MSDAGLQSLGMALDETQRLIQKRYPELAKALKGQSVPIEIQLPQLEPTLRRKGSALHSQSKETLLLLLAFRGTRTPSGGYTKAWSGHRDMGDGNWNRGTVSGGRGTSLKPEQVDKQWRGILAQTATNVKPWLRAMGLQAGTAAYNNVLFSALDLRVQAPKAMPTFIQNVSARKDFTIEGIAKARADAFFNRQTGRLDTTFPSYTALLRDQRSRAGVLQYRRRI